MKKYFFIVIFFAGVISCKDGSDLLDPEVVTVLTEEEVFSDTSNAMNFLNDIYMRIVPVIPQGANKGMRWPGSDAMLEVTTDNGATNLSGGTFGDMNQGKWTFASAMFTSTSWTDYWSAIRACNIFLSHIDDMPLNAEFQFDEPLRILRKGEVFFLKAFFYSELFKQFGGLPLEDRVVGITDELKIPRNTVDETVNYIVDLCDRATEILPTVHTANDYGRPTKEAALALKACILLYAASPLWNNSAKPEDSPFRGKYDAAKWNMAASVAAAVIELNQYQLHTDISNLFFTRMNPELIFVHLQQPCAWMTSISIPFYLRHPNGSPKSGCISMEGYFRINTAQFTKFFQKFAAGTFSPVLLNNLPGNGQQADIGLNIRLLSFGLYPKMAVEPTLNIVFMQGAHIYI